LCVGEEGEGRFAGSKGAAFSEEEGDKDEGKGSELWAVTRELVGFVLWAVAVELGGFLFWAVTGEFSGVSCAWAWSSS
jgi:hypothetical protein